ncbi:MAG: hypothetical protein PHT88_00475 [Candidatus Moranbacteria bacterium]|nr:hypothetical protein [Candidatus Moranbacteria bacterium]
MDKLILCTYFHGQSALKKYEAILIDKESCRYQTALPGSRVLTFEYPHIDKFKKIPPLLLFEGLTFTDSMTDSVKELPITLWKESDSGVLSHMHLTRELVSRKATTTSSNPSDLTFDSFARGLRRTEGNQVIQEIKLHLFAILANDARFLFVAYEARSLKPMFKIVKNLPSELSIEAAVK